MITKRICSFSIISKVIFFLLLISFHFGIYCQIPVALGQNKGIIFNQDLQMYFYTKYKNRFELELQDVIEIEKILNKEFPLINKAKYRRQYVGFLNTKSQKVVFVNLIDFKKKNKLLKDWKCKLIIGTGDFYDRKTMNMYVNLETGTVE